jgi:hypothetical protein
MINHKANIFNPILAPLRRQFLLCVTFWVLFLRLVAGLRSTGFKLTQVLFSRFYADLQRGEAGFVHGQKTSRRPHLLSFVALSFLMILSGSLPAQVNFDWAIAQTGTEAAFTYDVEVDQSGYSYMTGEFLGTHDFDPGPGVFNLVAGTSDVFFAKYDAEGNLVWARSIGSAGGDSGTDIWIDEDGNVVLSGVFIAEMDADPGPGIYNLFSVDNNDGFLAKYTPDGNFIWAFNLGSPNFERCRAVTGDFDGNIYVVTEIKGTCDFDPGPATVNFTNFGSGDSEIMLAKYSPAGAYIWASRMGGTGNDLVRDVKVTPSGFVYITGEFALTADFDPSAAMSNLVTTGSLDGFVAKYSAATGAFVWAIKMGGTGSDVTYAISLDTLSNLYASGKFIGTADFDPSAGVSNLVSAGSDDGFLAKYDSMGVLMWANRLGSTSVDRVQAVHADPLGNVFISGRFRNTVDFDFSAGVNNLTALAADDGFAAMYTSAGDLQWAGAFRGTSQEEALSLANNNHGMLVTGGYFLGVLDFDPSADSLKVDGGVKGSGWITHFNVPSQDTAGPSMSCAASGGIYTLDDFGNCPVFISDFDAGTTDDCGIDSLWISDTLFVCGDTGPQDITLYARDIFGKMDSCVTSIVLADSLPPMVACFNFEAYLDSNGLYVIDPMLLDNGSTDNCGIDSMWTIPSQLTCPDTGWVEVTLLVRDYSGNIDSCSAPVHLNDTIGATRVKVSLPSDFQYCSLANINLAAPGGYPNYLWSTGSTSQGIHVTGPGVYWVNVWNEYGCDGSDTIVVFGDKPDDELLDVPSPVTLCNDDSLEIHAEPGYTSYLWSTGATTDFINISIGGLFGVTVTDTLGCIFYDSAFVSYYAVPGPGPVISPGGLIGICDGTTRILSAGAGYSSYLWNTGEISDMIVVAVAGKYAVQVTNGFGCVGVSDTVTVVAASAPVISFSYTGSGDTLFSAPAGLGYAFRWWVNGAFIPGAVEEWYIPLWSGKYKVETTSPEGCVSSKDTTLSIIGIPDPLSQMEMVLSPNPTRGGLQLVWDIPAGEGCEIGIQNMMGQQMQALQVPVGTSRAELDLGSYANGIYLITYNDGLGIRSWKVIRTE